MQMEKKMAHVHARWTTLIAGLALGIVAVTGCTSTTEPPATPTATVDADRVSPPDLPEIPAVTDEAGAIGDASFDECAIAAGAQSVTGTVTNSTEAAIDYAVTVSWVNETSDVRARGVAVVEAVEPAAEESFTVKADVPEGATTCTFHVVRGSID